MGAPQALTSKGKAPVTFTFTLQELEERVQKRYDQECRNEASQIEQYLAYKQGCDRSDVTLPENFIDNLFIVENGAKHIFGPTWAKRVDEDFVVLRTGRRFSIDDYTEIIWEDKFAEEDRIWELEYSKNYDIDDDLSCADDEDDGEDDIWEEDDLADYEKYNVWGGREDLKERNVVGSSLLPNCRVIPYTLELEKMILWGEECNSVKYAYQTLNERLKREDNIKRIAKYAYNAFVGALVVAAIFLAVQMFIIN